METFFISTITCPPHTFLLKNFEVRVRSCFYCYGFWIVNQCKTRVHGSLFGISKHSGRCSIVYFSFRKANKWSLYPEILLLEKIEVSQHDFWFKKQIRVTRNTNIHGLFDTYTIENMREIFCASQCYFVSVTNQISWQQSRDTVL